MQRDLRSSTLEGETLTPGLSPLQRHLIHIATHILDRETPVWNARQILYAVHRAETQYGERLAEGEEEAVVVEIGKRFGVTV